jgi:hypothetical protein
MYIDFMTLLTDGLFRTTQQCPKCGSQEVCRSHRNGRLDRFLSLVNIYPYRCRQLACNVRFYLFGRIAKSLKKQDRADATTSSANKQRKSLNSAPKINKKKRQAAILNAIDKQGKSNF